MTKFVLLIIFSLSFSTAFAKTLLLTEVDELNIALLIEAVQRQQSNSVNEDRTLILDFNKNTYVTHKSHIDVSDFLTLTLWSDVYNITYPNGDAYFLIGHLEDDWTAQEYQRFYAIAKWLSIKGFRPIINPVPVLPDIQEAVQNPNTSVLIWSSHGSIDGEIYDKDMIPLPHNIFSKNASLRLKHFVFSNCFGNVTVTVYQFPSSAKKHFWEGTTDTVQLFDYLLSDKWDMDLKKDLGIPRLDDKSHSEVNKK